MDGWMDGWIRERHPSNAHPTNTCTGTYLVDPRLVPGVDEHEVAVQFVVHHGAALRDGNADDVDRLDVVAEAHLHFGFGFGGMGGEIGCLG